jgi:AcrR family transcriptional regulator
LSIQETESAFKLGSRDDEEDSMPAPVASAPRERARSARRQALLETAEQVFAERGFEGATMAEIATRAGYSAGNLYNVFDQGELFREVITHGAQLVHDGAIATLAASTPIAEALDRFVDALVRFVLDHRGLFALYTRMTEGQDWSNAHLSEESRRLRDAVHDAMVGRLRRAMTAREIPKEDPDAGADLIGGTLQRHLVRWIDVGGREDELLRSLGSVRRLLRRALGVKS